MVDVELRVVVRVGVDESWLKFGIPDEKPRSPTPNCERRCSGREWLWLDSTDDCWRLLETAEDCRSPKEE